MHLIECWFWSFGVKRSHYFDYYPIALLFSRRQTYTSVNKSWDLTNTYMTPWMHHHKVWLWPRQSSWGQRNINPNTVTFMRECKMDDNLKKRRPNWGEVEESGYIFATTTQPRHLSLAISEETPSYLTNTYILREGQLFFWKGYWATNT